MKFLVAVDGSDISHRALDHAIDLATAAGAAVTVAHVVDPPVYAETAPEPVTDLSEADRLYVFQRIEEAEELGQQIINGAVARASDRGFDATSATLYGDPVVAISDYAEEADFDSIVVGHHGASERSETAFGSVAKGLVTRSRVPVTVVR